MMMSHSTNKSEDKTHRRSSTLPISSENFHPRKFNATEDNNNNPREEDFVVEERNQENDLISLHIKQVPSLSVKQRTPSHYQQSSNS